MATPDVRAIEKVRLRKVGFGYHLDLHVQTEPGMTLHNAHVLSGRVKAAIRAAVPEITAVLIHMEPYEL
jgi:divalent metal cation (Fe/Co/Zn/Cd) transporter